MNTIGFAGQAAVGANGFTAGAVHAVAAPAPVYAPGPGLAELSFRAGPLPAIALLLLVACCAAGLWWLMRSDRPKAVHSRSEAEPGSAAEPQTEPHTLHPA